MQSQVTDWIGSCDAKSELQHPLLTMCVHCD